MDISAYLPSKKFALRVAVIGGLILVSLGISYGIKKYQAKHSGEITLGQAIEQDSDGDGILDWQEKLYGLDPFNSDSDGDGLLDNQEIPSSLFATESSHEPVTQTEKLSQDLYVAMTALSQNDSLDPTAKENLAHLVSEYIAQSGTPELWDRSHINVVRNSRPYQEAYITKYAEISERYSININPIEILESAMHYKDPSRLGPITEFRIMHENLIRDLRALQVPESFVVYHLALINSLSKIATDLWGMEQYFKDPVLTFSGIFLYNDHMQEFTHSIRSMNDKMLQPLLVNSQN